VVLANLANDDTVAGCIILPSHSRLAACALCDTMVDDRVANLSLGAVVRWFDARVSQEAEVIFFLAKAWSGGRRMQARKPCLMASIFRMKVF